MELRKMLEAFANEQTPELLLAIRKKYGKYGFSLACKVAGISRGQGKRMLGLYDDTKAIRQLANRLCGMKTSRWQ
ncbi:hypothetical protein [Carboxydothermus hydrogenoformans]|uniref:hypothetical protein n=1 Tax=Carboxydothermus hydrogenoformans TaxID=129958 RepID=UPI0005A0E3D3|nr:hypothetical protein [Carboxydothermus hydrogenoformans]